jgi:hypothetical protein
MYCGFVSAKRAFERAILKKYFSRATFRIYFLRDLNILRVALFFHFEISKFFVLIRNELFSAQARLAETAATIRSIEVLNMKDQKLARALKKKHAILDQQTQMKQQKESQFLREIQLCKTRQLQQVRFHPLFYLKKSQ